MRAFKLWVTMDKNLSGEMERFFEVFALEMWREPPHLHTLAVPFVKAVARPLVLNFVSLCYETGAFPTDWLCTHIHTLCLLLSDRTREWMSL